MTRNSMVDSRPAAAVQHHNEQIPLRSALMLSTFGAMGAFNTFRPVFLATILSPAELGAVSGLLQLIGIFVNPVVAAIGDLFVQHRAVAVLSCVGQAALQLCLLLPKAASARATTAILFAHALVSPHMLSILDSSTIATVGDRYGNVRLFGAVGFGALALGGGGLISISGDPNRRANFLMAFSLASALQLLSLPALMKLDLQSLQSESKKGSRVKRPCAESVLDAKPDAKPDSKPDSKPDPKPDPSMMHFLKKVASARSALFYLITYGSGISCGLIDTFLNVFLAQQARQSLELSSYERQLY